MTDGHKEGASPDVELYVESRKALNYRKAVLAILPINEEDEKIVAEVLKANRPTERSKSLTRRFP